MIGKNIFIHAFIEPGKLLHPYGSPVCMYPEVRSRFSYGSHPPIHRIQHQNAVG